MSNPERLFADAPFMGLFVDASLRSHEETGDCHISPEDQRVLMGVFGLEPGETAAYAYLAEKRAREITEDLNSTDLFGIIVNGESHD